MSDRRQENGKMYEYIIHNTELTVNTTYTFYDLIHFQLPSSAYNAIIRLAVLYVRKHQHTLPTDLLYLNIPRFTRISTILKTNTKTKTK